MAPDVEVALTAWLETTFSVRACTSLPMDLEQILPVVQVQRGGGATELFSDHPRVFVDVYAADEDSASDLALRVQEALMYLRGPVGGAVVRHVRCDAGPSERPYDNPAVHRRGATYTASLRAA